MTKLNVRSMSPMVFIIVLALPVFAHGQSSKANPNALVKPGQEKANNNNRDKDKILGQDKKIENPPTVPVVTPPPPVPVVSQPAPVPPPIPTCGMDQHFDSVLGTCVITEVVCTDTHQHRDVATNTCVLNQYSISSIQITPANAGTVYCNGEPCSTSKLYDYGTQVTLNANPGAGFAQVALNPGPVLTIGESNAVSASFACSSLHQHLDVQTNTCVSNQHSISSITVTPPGSGTVLCNGVPCSTSTLYDYGAEVKLSTSPGSGFVQVALDPGAVLTIGDDNVISASFACSSPHQHHDKLTGTCVWDQFSISSITISPAGSGELLCNGVPCSTTTLYDYGAQVQLSTNPASGYSELALNPGPVLTIGESNLVSASFECSMLYYLMNGHCELVPTGQAYTAAQLISALQLVKDDSKAKVDIMADIQLPDSISGELSPQLMGKIDGHGHSLSNLKYPMFTVVASTAQVTNLVVNVNMNISLPEGGAGNVGAGAITHINRGQIDNVTVNGSISAPAYVAVGGIAGYNYGTIAKSSSTANVSAYIEVGGIAGLNGGTISEVIATGSVTASGYFAGGIVGMVDNGGQVTMAKATGGGVSAPNNAGGLIGYHVYGTLTQSSTSKPVSGSDFLGGAIGVAEPKATIYQVTASGDVNGKAKLGGFLGQSKGALISRASATGNVNGTGYLGGFVGYIQGSSGDIENCFASGAVTGSENYRGGFAGSSEGGRILYSYAKGAVLPLGGDAHTTFTGGFVGNTVGLVRECVNGNPNWPFYGMATNAPQVPFNVDAAIATSVNSLYTYEFPTNWDPTIWDLTNKDVLPAFSWNFATAVANTVAVCPSVYYSMIDGSCKPVPAGQAYNYPQLAVALALSATDPAVTVQILGDIQIPDTVTTELAQNLLGKVNGNGFSITNLRYPMFANIAASGSVTNLSLNVNFTSGPPVGGNAYSGTGAFARTNRGSIGSCAVNGSIAAPAMVGVGGVAGYNYGVISGCTTTVNINGVAQVGGVAGFSGGTVTGVTATGAVTASAYSAGGIVGQLDNGGIVSRAKASGGSVAAMNQAGGIVGYSNIGNISECLSSKSVSGNDHIGGFIGVAKAQTSIMKASASGDVTGKANVIGGFAGQNYGGIISEASSSGNVTGVSYVGGFIGYIQGSTGQANNTFTTSNVYATGSYRGGFVGSSEGGRIFYSYALGTLLPSGADPKTTYTGGFAGYTVGLVQECVDGVPGWPYYGQAVNLPRYPYIIDQNSSTDIPYLYGYEFNTNWKNQGVWNLTNTTVMPTLLWVMP